MKTSKIGRRNKYTAIVTEVDYKAEQTVHFLNKIFEGNTKGLVSSLIEKDLLSPKDYIELQKHWRGGGNDE